MMIKGIIDQQNVSLGYVDKKKQVMLEREKILSKDYYGLFPAIFVSPYDFQLINEGSEFRRKYFDSFFSLLDSQYLQTLLSFQAILQRRNKLLLDFKNQRTFNKNLLDTIDFQFIKSGEELSQMRNNYFDLFKEYFKQETALINKNIELIEIKYEQGWDSSLKNELEITQHEDIALGRTQKGAHKADFKLYINTKKAKYTGSQGQIKTIVLSIKLAQIQMILHELKKAPLILLDDIFDKLDENRTHSFMNRLHTILLEKEHQIFMSDTSKIRLLEFTKMFENKKMIALPFLNNE